MLCSLCPRDVDAGPFVRVRKEGAVARVTWYNGLNTDAFFYSCLTQAVATKEGDGSHCPDSCVKGIREI